MERKHLKKSMRQINKKYDKLNIIKNKNIIYFLREKRY